VIVPDLGTNQVYQTRTHVVWEEGSGSGPRVTVKVVALDKKTLARRTLHGDQVPNPRTKEEMLAMRESNFRRNLWTNDDAVFLERTNDTLRLALDATPAVTLPKAPEAGGTHCADASSLYRFDHDKMSVIPLRPASGAPKASAPVSVSTPPGSASWYCRVDGDWVYLYVDHVRPPMRHVLGRVPTRGGAFTEIAQIDPLQDFGFSAAGGRVLFRTLSLAPPRTSRIFLAEEGKAPRMLRDGDIQQHHAAFNRTHVCWGESVPYPKWVGGPGPKAHEATFHRAEIWCAPLAGGSPSRVVDDAGFTYAWFLLDDDHLAWVDTRNTGVTPGSEQLVRIPVPR
jgi:hypothetical protein